MSIFGTISDRLYGYYSAVEAWRTSTRLGAGGPSAPFRRADATGVRTGQAFPAGSSSAPQQAPADSAQHSGYTASSGQRSLAEALPKRMNEVFSGADITGSMGAPAVDAEEAAWRSSIAFLENLLHQPAKSRDASPSARNQRPVLVELGKLAAEAHRAARALQTRKLRLQGIPVSSAIHSEHIIDDVGFAKAGEVLTSIDTLVRAPFSYFFRNPSERERARKIFRDLTGRQWLRLR